MRRVRVDRGCLGAIQFLPSVSRATLRSVGWHRVRNRRTRSLIPPGPLRQDGYPPALPDFVRLQAHGERPRGAWLPLVGRSVTKPHADSPSISVFALYCAKAMAVVAQQTDSKRTIGGDATLPPTRLASATHTPRRSDECTQSVRPPHMFDQMITTIFVVIVVVFVVGSACFFAWTVWRENHCPRCRTRWTRVVEKTVRDPQTRKRTRVSAWACPSCGHREERRVPVGV